MRLKNIKFRNILNKVVCPSKLFIVMFILLNFIVVYNTYVSKNRIDTYFRLHIVANSNSIDDQILKYTIAKKIDAFTSKLKKPVYDNKQEYKAILEENIQEILNICNEVIISNGKNYPVSAKFGKIYYKEKEKDNIYMDAGIYDSLQIIIGNGNGENWWSLVYPYAYEAIVIDESQNTEKTDDTNHISNYDIVSSDNISIKFGFLELFYKLFNK